MTTFFIIMAACMYPVLLILYGVMRYYGRPRGGVMFGAQLQLGLEKEPEVAEISRRFKREVTLWLLILAVIPLATLPVPYMSISVTFWMVWCFAAIFALQVPFARANRAVRAWKAEHGYGGERERRILVETRELDTVRSFRWTACIAPSLISLGAAGFAAVWEFWPARQPGAEYHRLYLCPYYPAVWGLRHLDGPTAAKSHQQRQPGQPEL